MKILMLLFFSLSLGHAQKPIPDRFRNIGNQTYYEYLDSDMHDSLEVIRERFLREMKKWHADDKERAQLLNEAFDAIKKEDVRERYNQWLLGQKYSFNSNTQDSRSTGNSARSREDVLHLIFKMIEVHLQQRGFIDSLTYLAEIGRTAITYNQRFLPGLLLKRVTSIRFSIGLCRSTGQGCMETGFITSRPWARFNLSKSGDSTTQRATFYTEKSSAI